MNVISSVHGRQIFDSAAVRPSRSKSPWTRPRSPGPPCPPAHPPAPTRPTNCATATSPCSRAWGYCGGRARQHRDRSAALRGRDVADQRGADQALRDLDGTAEPVPLGANAVLGASLAICRASAAADRAAAVPADRPARRIDRAEPADADGQHPLRRSARRPGHGRPGLPRRPGQRHLRARGHPAHLPGPRRRHRMCAERGLPTLLADEGGLSPGCRTGREALELLTRSIETAGLQPGIESPSPSTWPRPHCTTQTPATTTCDARSGA